MSTPYEPDDLDEPQETFGPQPGDPPPADRNAFHAPPIPDPLADLTPEALDLLRQNHWMIDPPEYRVPPLLDQPPADTADYHLPASSAAPPDDPQVAFVNARHRQIQPLSTLACQLIAAQFEDQRVLELRAQDNRYGATQQIVAPANRARRLQLARALAYAANELRLRDGLSNEVVNLIHEANRLIARRPNPPRRRRISVKRMLEFLKTYGADPVAFSTAELGSANIRFSVRFATHSPDEAHPALVYHD
ncbi:MAG: hypothetical protein ACREJ2_15000, partial [Planctomycetota bacterium]